MIDNDALSGATTSGGDTHCTAIAIADKIEYPGKKVPLKAGFGAVMLLTRAYPLKAPETGSNSIDPVVKTRVVFVELRLTSDPNIIPDGLVPVTENVVVLELTPVDPVPDMIVGFDVVISITSISISYELVDATVIFGVIVEVMELVLAKI
jgi:hypothetical protein